MRNAENIAQQTIRPELKAIDDQIDQLGLLDELGEAGWHLYDQEVIKKYATGKGNANKEVMYEAFNAELLTPPDLKTILKPKSTKLTSPVTDIVDAYFIAKWGWEGFVS